MRTPALWMILGLVFALGCSSDHSETLALLRQENAQLRAITGPPPASLDSLYPPKAPAPLYQIKMFEMAAPLTGLMIRLNEGDRRGARALYDAFRKQYTELSGLVPEWKEAYPSEPLDDLDRLIEQGEPGKVMEAVEKVGGICHDCHVSTMPGVQQQYHWRDFSAISLTDPATTRDLDFKRFMLSLDLSFVGIGMETQAGSVAKARKHFDNFRNGYNELKGSCQACHDTERKYFVDAEVDGLVGKLGTALTASVPDGAAVSELIQRIGMESCGKCHLVHIPAAYARTRWAKLQQGTK